MGKPAERSGNSNEGSRHRFCVNGNCSHLKESCHGLQVCRKFTATFGALYQARHSSGLTGAISTAQYPGTVLLHTMRGGPGDLSGPDQHLDTSRLSRAWGLAETSDAGRSAHVVAECAHRLLSMKKSGTEVPLFRCRASRFRGVGRRLKPAAGKSIPA
jgi:hypothetical protein